MAAAIVAAYFSRLPVAKFWHNRVLQQASLAVILKELIYEGRSRFCRDANGDQ
jgi:hypothetical protein